MFYSLTNRGSALIVTLMLITVIAILTLAFLVAMQLDRQSTLNYSQSIKAEELGHGALQEIIGDLMAEINAGSKQSSGTYTVNGISIYVPVTNQTFEPARIGFPAADFGTDVDTVNKINLPPTLVRVSRASDPFYTTPPTYYNSSLLPPARASVAFTTNSSANGRSISLSRWNKPLFMGNTNTAVPSTFAAYPPQWIYVTRSGSQVFSNSPASLIQMQTDRTGSNTNAVVGRYAYVIYDEGGLLDINTAGALTTNSPPFQGKSYTAYADLTQISGLTQPLVDNLVNWRNGGGISTYGNYTNVVADAATNGFLIATPGDNPLFGRQDLINYLSAVIGSTTAAPYLSTFSRTVSAASWSPDTPTGSTVNYAAQAETAGIANRDMANLRMPTTATVTHYYDNGTTGSYTINQGQPFLQRRFSLAKLSWLTADGPSADLPTTDPLYNTEYNAAGTDTNILACFGLQWDSTNLRWTYIPTASTMPSNNVIQTLDAIASEGREPNFFELLKAAILSGSLGRDPGILGSSSGQGVNGALFNAYSSVADAQILQIGANIIDQSTPDSYPVAIYCNIYGGVRPVDALFNTFVGVENLPYLHRLLQITMATTPGQAWQKTTPPINSTTAEIGGWLQPEIWNPHQAPVTISMPRPTNFRVRSWGNIRTGWSQTQVSPASAPLGYGTNILNYGGYIGGVSATAGTNFTQGLVYFSDPGGTTSLFYSNPTALTTANLNTTNTMNPNCLWQTSYPDSINKFAAIYTGSDSFNYLPQGSNGGTGVGNVGSNPLPMGEVTFSIEYQDPAGNWRPYGQMARIEELNNNQITLQPNGLTMVGGTTPACFYLHTDPRTDRFSVSEDFITDSSSLFTLNTTIQPSSSALHCVASNWPQSTSSAFSYPTTSGSEHYLGDWQVNNNTAPISKSYYADPDGIVRPADGYRRNLTTGDGCLTFTNAPTTILPRRPVILDRPFLSLGELGYAFRDEPYKSIDFWTPLSGDAALLDIFSVTDEPTVVAGQINFNHAPVTVLEAVLNGASKAALVSTINLPTEAPSEVPILAQAIATQLSTAPLRNRADLVTKLSTTIDNSFSAAADQDNKAYVEAPVRALSSVANTRTWNLMIDVIAQSGSMIPNATSLDQFLVEGEKRYWLHIAIDRFTGKIIDQQLEPVYE